MCHRPFPGPACLLPVRGAQEAGPNTNPKQNASLDTERATATFLCCVGAQAPMTKPRTTRPTMRTKRQQRPRSARPGSVALGARRAPTALTAARTTARCLCVRVCVSVCKCMQRQGCYACACGVSRSLPLSLHAFVRALPVTGRTAPSLRRVSWVLSSFPHCCLE